MRNKCSTRARIKASRVDTDTGDTARNQKRTRRGAEAGKHQRRCTVSQRRVVVGDRVPEVGTRAARIMRSRPAEMHQYNGTARQLAVRGFVSEKVGVGQHILGGALRRHVNHATRRNEVAQRHLVNGGTVGGKVERCVDMRARVLRALKCSSCIVKSVGIDAIGVQAQVKPLVARPRRCLAIERVRKVDEAAVDAEHARALHLGNLKSSNVHASSSEQTPEN